MITVVLISLVCMAAILQPNTQRLYAATATAALTCGQFIACDMLDGLAYYASAALVDTFVVFALSLVRPIPRMVLHLQVLSIVSIAFNLAGFVMWYFYQPPTLYNNAYLAFYATMVVVFLWRGKQDHVGGYSAYSWRACVRFIVFR
jgi:hypothetical protein